MFFKKIIQKNIKLLAVLGVVISILGFGVDISLAEQSMDLPILNSTGSKWVKQASNGSWTEVIQGYERKMTFDTTQKPKGMTDGGTRGQSQVDDKNIGFIKQSTAVEFGGAYYIGSGKLNSGYSITVGYDKNSESYDPLDDRMTQIRVETPDGKSYLYAWAGGAAIVKEGSGEVGRVNDKEILDALGKQIGQEDLYSIIAEADIESKYANVFASAQAAVEDGTMTQAEADKLRNAIINEKNLTDAEKAEIQPIISKINARLKNNGRSNNDLLSVGEGSVVRTVSQNDIATSNVSTAAAASGRANDESKGDFNGKLDECWVPGYITGTLNPSACFAEALYFILSILAFFLGVVGLFFNLVFEVTLVNMAKNVNQIGIVSTGWATIRDFANILFIFMLLYLAISTILQLDDHGVKKGLSRLIVGAALINFSLFFVKIPIDVSNMLAIEIYDTVNPDPTGAKSLGLGDVILAMFSPQKVFNNESLDPKTIIEANNKSGKSPEQIRWNLQTNPVTTFAMGIVVIFTALLIFLAVCIVFIKRFITLVMLMIFSPLAFAGMAIPNHDIEHQIGSKFWSSLLKESFYAPVFMFMMYLTIKTGIALNGGLVGAKSAGILNDLVSVPVTNIISYSVVMGMMIFSLTVSETMGVKGASGAIKFFDAARSKTAGWAARNTGGALAYNLIEKTGLGIGWKDKEGKFHGGIKQWRQSSNFFVRGIGNTLTNGLQKAGEGRHHDIERDQASFKDSMNELRDDPEAQAEFMAKMLKGKKSMGGLIQPYNQVIAKYAGTAMKDDEVATSVQYMRKKGYHESADTLVNYLGKERKSNVEEIISNKITKFHRNELGELAEGLKHIDNYQKTGEIKVDDGHGGLDTHTGAEAVAYLNKTYEAGLDATLPFDTAKSDKIIQKIKTMFGNFTEKQKTEVLSTLSSAQQKALAADEDFVKEMEKHFTNYRMMDSVMKGSMAKELQEQLGYIAYKGAGRFRIDTTLRSEKFNLELNSKDKKIKGEAEKRRGELLQEWRNFNDNKEWIENYKPEQKEEKEKMEKLLSDYKTLLQAERNYSRVAAENKDYKRVAHETSDYVDDKGNEIKSDKNRDNKKQAPSPEPVDDDGDGN